ncbi:unnamed protein product, partial [Candidula unifasciata]
MERAPEEPPQRLKPEGHPTRDELVKSVRTPNGTKKRKGPTATSTPLDKEKLETIEAQIIQAGPKPVSRRKVIISQDQPTYNGANAVDDTVSQVVSGFIPGISQTMSSVTGKVRRISPPSLKGPLTPEASTVEESDEGEELSARPAPSRSSLRMESGSEEDSRAITSRLIEDIHLGKPKPRTRTQLLYSEAVLSASPARSVSASEQEGKHNFESFLDKLVFMAVESDSDKDGLWCFQSWHVESMGRQKKRRTKSGGNGSDTLTIVVSEVSFEPDSQPMLDDNVRQLYVEYRFYGVDPAETETPFSLPKPKANQPITFNFSKTIPVDIENNYERRRYLASMLLPNHSDGEMECEDVGVAY